MFLESFGGKGRKELESQFEQLGEQLKNKQAELNTKEAQIQHLSKNIRKWTRKYHELELSISENDIDDNDALQSEHEKETKQLREMLLKLNKKNRALEKRLDKLNSIADQIEPKQNAAAKSDDEHNSFKKDRIVEPEFSVQIQSQFKEYAEKCR